MNSKGDLSKAHRSFLSDKSLIQLVGVSLRVFAWSCMLFDGVFHTILREPTCLASVILKNVCDWDSYQWLLLDVTARQTDEAFTIKAR